MSLSGTRGIIRVSKNSSCELQAAMAAERVPEVEFYRMVTGREYPGEYGERASARRRGAKFEANLHANNAAALRNVLAPLLGLDADRMTVRNFGEEVPGARHTIRAARLHRTRLILGDLARGREVPHLLIQPQLALPVGPGARDFEYVSPDFLALDPATRMYRPGEEKSFIVRGGVADGSDLDGTRRQAAIQILALRAEATRSGIDPRVDERAIFVFATPFGMKPADPFHEELTGELREIRRALDALVSARRRLTELRAGDAAPLQALTGELRCHFQDSCFGSCVMADHCQRQHDGTVRGLGDRPVELVGGDLRTGRLADLVAGSRAANERETELKKRLDEVGVVLPWLAEALRRRRRA
jgi:hypothetical protein